MDVPNRRTHARLAAIVVIFVNLAASLSIATPALAAPDFQIVIEPPSQLLPPGGSVSFQIRLAAIDGFNQPVSLEVGDLPEGVDFVLSQEEVTPPGTAILTLIAEEGAATGSFDLVVTATGDGITHVTSGSVTVDFGLVPMCYGSLEGTVTDEETGTPIAGVTILGVLITDANGHWGPYQAGLGTNNSPAFYSVRAQMAGYWDGSGDATAICDQTTRVDIQLLKMHPAAIFGSVVEGTPDQGDPTVVIPNGPAIEGVQISVQFFPDPPMFPVDTSAADGSYHIDLDHLNPDNQPLADVHLRAVLDGFWPRDFGAPSPLPIGDLAANQEKVVDTFGLVRQCTGSISGSLTYADTGEPAAEVTVTAGHLWEFKSTSTTALGEFSFPDLLLGYNNQPVDFGVSAAGSDLYFGDSATVHLDACGEHRSTEIALEPMGPFGNLEGHVYDEATGEPVAGVMVGPISGCHPCITDNATTDATGYYRIHRMPADFAPAIYSIVTAHPDYWQSGDQVEVVADDTVTLDLQILKRRFAEVTGQVRDAISGLPIEGASIGFAPSAVQSDANGNYISPKLEVGFRNEPLEIAVGAGAAGYWLSEERVVLRPDESSELDFELIPICVGATVRGTVVDALTHDPIADAQVFASGGGFDLTDENGDYLIEGVSVGINNSPIEATVTATADGYHPQSRTITVFCGGSFTIEFGPEPPVSAVEGYVTNAVTGDPIAGVFIGAEFGDMTTTDVDGYYLFDEVPLNLDGTSRIWTITAAPDGFDSQTKSVTVEPNLTARLDFAFGTPVQAPDLSVTKTPTPANVPAGGGSVTFEISVTNGGGSATLTTLVDDVFGDLGGAGSCSAPQSLASGGTYSCSFSEEVTGTPGTDHVNTVTATAVNDGGTDQARGSATVGIMDNDEGGFLVRKTNANGPVDDEWAFSVEGGGPFVGCDASAIVLAGGEQVQCFGEPGQVVTITEPDPGDRYVLTDINCFGAPNADIDLATRSVTITLDDGVTGCDFTNTFQEGAPTSQLTPTGTECIDFATRSAADQEEVLYHQKSTKVGSVNPGVFIYWTAIEAPAASFTIAVNQMGTTLQGVPATPPLFRVHNDGPKLFDANCVRVRKLVIQPAPRGQSIVSVTGATPGAVYYFTTKYDSQSISGTAISTNPEFRAAYTFSTLLNGNLVTTSSDSLLLRRH